MNEDHKVQAPNFEGEEMKMPENTDSQPAVKPEKSSVINGPLLLILAVLLVGILGGMYYWFGTLTATPADTPIPERPTPEQNNEPESTTAEAQAGAMMTTSSSDEISAIEADVEATDLDDLDAELNAIDAEFEASAQE